MHRAQRVAPRTRIIDQYHRARERERAGQHLAAQHDTEQHPDEPGGAFGEEDQEGDRDVREDREGEERPVARQGAEFGVEGRIQEDLEREADDAEDGHCEADFLLGEAQAAGPVERGEVVRGVWGVRGGEEEDDESVEGAEVEGEEVVGCEREEDVSREDSAEGGFYRRCLRVGRGRCRGGCLLFRIRDGSENDVRAWRGLHLGLVWCDPAVPICIALRPADDAGDELANPPTIIWFVAKSLVRFVQAKDHAHC